MSLSPDITDSDIQWLAGLKEGGHCGEGTFEYRERMARSDRIDRLVSALNAARSVPLSVEPEEIARLLADHFGHRPFDQMATDKQDLRMKVRTLDGFDVNEPHQDDCREAAQAILSKLGREEDCSSGGRVPASPDGLTEGPLSAGWERTDTAPYACCVLASRFDRDVGEWVYGVVMSPPSYPFTHWMPLPEAPAENSAGQPSVASASALATDEHPHTPSDPQRREG